MISKLKHKINESVRNGKLNVFLLFFFFALVILLLTKLTKTHTKALEFKVSVNNLPEEFVLLNEDSLYLDVTLKAKGYKMISYYLSNPKLELDFEELNKQNDSIFYWDRKSNFLQLNNNFSNEEEVIQAKPERLLFQFDINEVVKIPVVLNSRIEFTQGYDLLSGFNLVPDSVTIVGPKSITSKIDFVSTDTLVLKNVNSNIDKQVKIHLTDNTQGVKISDRVVKVHGEIEKFSEGTVTVPFVVKNSPEDVTIKTFPKVVTVVFYTSLSNFNKVKANDFKVECDYAIVTSGSPYLIPKLVKKPNIVKTARVNQDRIEFILN